MGQIWSMSHGLPTPALTSFEFLLNFLSLLYYSMWRYQGQPLWHPECRKGVYWIETEMHGRAPKADEIWTWTQSRARWLFRNEDENGEETPTTNCKILILELFSHEKTICDVRQFPAPPQLWWKSKVKLDREREWTTESELWPDQAKNQMNIKINLIPYAKNNSKCITGLSVKL